MAKRHLDLDNLPSNNQLTPNKDISPVTTGRVRTKQAGFSTQVRDIGNGLFESIIVPAVKDAIVAFFTNGVSQVIFGQETNTRGRSRHRSYNRMYDNEEPVRRTRRSQGRVVHRPEPVYEDIFFENRQDAGAVLGRMMELVGEYGWASLGDLYSLVGMSSNFTNERYGWDQLSHCRVHYSPEGYYIDLPEPSYSK
jgi:hypothetical protein